MKTLGAFLLIAQSALAQTTLDIVEQDIVADFTGTPSITTTVHVMLNGPTTELYVPNPGFPSQIARWDGAEVALEPVAGTSVAVHITLPTEQSGPHDLVLELSGTPQCHGATYDGCVVTSEEIFLLPAGNGPAFYAFNFFRDDNFSATLHVRVPPSFEVLAGQGAVQSIDTETDGARTWNFSTAYPDTNLFIYARAVTRISSSDGRVYALGAPSLHDAIAPIAELASQLLPIHERNFGELPIHEVHLLAGTGRYPFGALGLFGNVLFSDIVFDPQYAYLREQGVAHELAHTWWGGIASSGPGTDAEQAISQEAFAEYSAWRALGELRGNDARISGVRMNSTWYMYRRPGDEDVAPLAADPSSPLAIYVIYHKSSSVLRLLEARVGVDAFTRALRAMLRGGQATLNQISLIAALETEASFDATAILDEWMNHPGFAHVGVASTRAEDGIDLELTLEGDYTLRVPIAVRMADGTKAEQTVDLTRGSRSVHVPHCAAIEIDPEWTIVRELRPAVPGDVTFDGRVDGADLMEVALRNGTFLPDTRRIDGGYDPLFDVDGNRRVEDADLIAVHDASR